MIFSPLDLVFFKQIFPKKVRVQSWQHIHIQQQIRQKKLESKDTPKKVRVQPHNPRHRNPFSPRFRPSWSFWYHLHFWWFFSPLDLVFFQQIFPKKVRVQSWQHIHIQQQIRQKKLESKNTPKKVRVQPHNPRHRNPFSPRFRPSWSFWYHLHFRWFFHLWT